MKTVLLVIKKTLGSAAIYFGVFCTLLIFFNFSLKDNGQMSYEGKKMRIAVQDADDSVLSRALAEFLGKENMVTVNADEELVTGQLFDGMLEYVIYVPKGFLEDFVNNPETSRIERVSINASVAFLDQKTEQFFRYVRTELAMGKSMEDACAAAMELLDIGSKTELLGKKKSIAETRGYYFLAFFAYAAVSLQIMIIGPIMQAFYRKEIHMRNECSATRRQTLVLKIAGGASLGVLLIYLVLMGLGLALDYKDFTVKLFLFAMLNAFLFMLVGFAISLIAGMLLKGNNALNGACNLIGMGMSFLGGVFVSMDLLPDYVRKISAFIPVTWYMKNVILIFQVNFEDSLGEYFTNLGVLAVFAAAFFCLALVVSGKKRIA